MNWLHDAEAKQECLVCRQKLLEDKIDVTGYIVEVVENCVYSFRKR